MGSAVSSDENDWLKDLLDALKVRDAAVDPAGVSEAPVARDVVVDAPPRQAPPGSIPIPASAPVPVPGPALELDSVGARTCVFVGPASAGKTCVLAAMNAACYADTGAPELELAIVADGQARANAQLLHDGVNWIGLGTAPPATRAETVHAVELTAQQRRVGLGRRVEVHPLRFVDAPGELYFPQPGGARGRAAFGSALLPPPIRELAVADAIVVVVDATRPCLMSVEANLPRLLDRIATPISGESLPQSRVARALARLGLVRSPMAPRRTRLTAGRILLLLTKVDVLATEMARALAHSDDRASAAAVASAIDPVALAIEVVGERIVRRLYRAIGADAEFAVGICSATGFCGGDAFSRWSRGRSPDERLRAWAPFGVREALHYVALGRCQGTVQRVTQTEAQGGEAFAVDRYTFQEMP